MQRHRHVATVGGDRRDGLRLARVSPALLRGESTVDRRLVVLRRRVGELGGVRVVPGNAGERSETLVIGDGPRHVPGSGADADGDDRKIAGPLVGGQRGHGGPHVDGLTDGVFELARFTLALAERSMVEGQGGEASLGECPRVRSGRLLLHRRQRASGHHSRHGLACREVQGADQSVTAAGEREGLACRVTHRSRNTSAVRCIPIVTAFAVLAACGGDDGNSSPSVDIGDGRTMFLECMGDGEPTVILESGIHDSSEYWTVSQLLPPAVDPPVMQGLAETNRGLSLRPTGHGRSRRPAGDHRPVDSRRDAAHGR